MTGLISSVSEEGKRLTGHLRKDSDVGGKPVYKGRIGGKNVVYVVAGMGKTNAAHAATVLLEKFSPRKIILFGIGGAYPQTGLKVGDVALAEREVYGDEGVVTSRGFQGTEYLGIPFVRRGRKKFFNEFPLDRGLLDKAARFFHRAAQNASPLPKTRTGTFVTVSACTGSKKRAIELRTRYDAVCENMEGAAVAHICALYDIPLLEIRGISNIVEDRDKGKWDIKVAADNCQRYLIGLAGAL